MSLTAKDIAEIAKLLDTSQFASLDLTVGEFKLRIRRDGGWSGRSEEREEALPNRTPAQAEASGDGEGGPRLRGAAQGAALKAGEVDVPAPLLGNFYAAARPGEPPFVAVGDTVRADSMIGIIEVMKLMNSVRAGVSGTVTAILAVDGKPVEEGQSLIRVKTGA
ncbi:MAG: biotin/lipoyl-containing protein [Croceibacterium sp.]